MDGNDFEVDEMRLEAEWVKQPGLFMRYNQQLTAAQDNRDRARAKLDLLQAQVSSAVRADPERYGVPAKYTEAVITNAVTTNADVQAAQKQFFDFRAEAAYLDRALTALEHKKKALESLVSLHAMGYYSAPKERSVPRGAARGAEREKAAALPRKIRRRETDNQNHKEQE